MTRTIHPWIGFHTGSGGNADGIGDHWRSLAERGIPVFSMAADGFQLEAQEIAQDQPQVPHVVIYRRSVVPAGASPPPGGNPDIPDYTLTPAAAAAAHVAWHLRHLPPELAPGVTWIAICNEPDRNRIGWLAEFHLEADRLLAARGFRHVMYNWSPGEPELEAWSHPAMVALLERMASPAHRDRTAMGVHEYSLRMDAIWTTPTPGGIIPVSGPADSWLVGRSARVLERIGRSWAGRIFITELGWTLWRVAEPWTTAQLHLDQLLAFYRNYPQVMGGALWWLGPKFQDIARRLQPYIAPATTWIRATTYQAADWPPATDPAPPPPPPPPATRPLVIVVKVPQPRDGFTADHLAQVARQVHPLGHTITPAHTDMATMVQAGDPARSFVKVVRPDLPSQREATALLASLGIRWEELVIPGQAPPPAPAPPPPAPAPPPTGPINLARAFVPANGARRSPVYVLQNGIRDQTTTTETVQLQLMENGTILLVKNRNWEHLRIHQGYIERRADWSMDESRFYILRDPGREWSRWAPAQVSAGQIYSRSAQVSIYHKGPAGPPCSPAAAPYIEASVLRIVSHHATMALPRTLHQVAEVTVAEFAATAGSGWIERYYLAAGLYLVGWEAADGRWSFLANVHPERPPLVPIQPCAPWVWTP